MTDTTTEIPSEAPDTEAAAPVELTIRISLKGEVRALTEDTDGYAKWTGYLTVKASPEGAKKFLNDLETSRLRHVLVPAQEGTFYIPVENIAGVALP